MFFLNNIDSKIKKDFKNKIISKISDGIENENIIEYFNGFQTLTQLNKCSSVIELADSLEEDISVIDSIAKLYINKINDEYSEENQYLNYTWMAYMIMAQINSYENTFGDYNENLQTLSGYFKEMFDEETGYWYLYYVQNNFFTFCGIFETEEMIEHLKQICYGLVFDVERWNEDNYLLKIIEKETGDLIDDIYVDGVLINKNYYYEILGVNQDSTQEEIKIAYRNKCREYHPDVYKEGDATEKMSLINEAYNSLKK